MTTRAVVAAAIVIGALGDARADDSTDDSTDERSRTIRLVALGGAITAYVLSDFVFDDELAPKRCRWCSANWLDTDVRDAARWSDPARARAASHVTAYVLVPLVATSLLIAEGARADGDRWHRISDDLMTVAEAAFYGQVLTNLVKITVGRERPNVHFARDPRARQSEDNRSFFSGHSSLAFSAAVAAGAIAHRRDYRLEPVIWAAGLSLAAATAYLRVAGDRHYLTDVVAGAAFGAACGLFIPRLTGTF